jgi:hypothetical protein
MPRPLENYVSVNERVESATPAVLAPIRRVAVSAPAMLSEAHGFMQAMVELEDGRTATGTASFDLSLTGKTAQATNPIEDCETSAVGRALAFLGYHANRSIASREEVQEAQRRRDARPERPATNGNGAPALTPAQRGAADALRRAGITGQAAVEVLGRHGAERISELKDADAQALILEVGAE